MFVELVHGVSKCKLYVYTAFFKLRVPLFHMACIQPINVLFNVKGNQHQWWFLLCRVGANLFLLTKIVPISCFVNTPKSDDRKYENVDLV